MKKVLLGLLFLVLSTFTFAQRGKDGDKVVSGSPEYVNAYTYLTVNSSVGDTIITVNNSNLNSNFGGNLSQGDLILIIQVQGVTIFDNAHPNQTPGWGEITDYLNCGNYEFKEVVSVPNGTSIIVDCPLNYAFSTNGKTIIARVPRYNSLTINNGAVLSVPQWNGNSGGILAVEVLGTTTISAGGSVDVSALGFRGGNAYDPTTVISGGDRYADQSRTEGAEKGEGIAGDLAYLAANTNGPFCRAAAANAGGGANAHNAGGGGGGNGGDPTGWVNGLGNPDASTANYAQAWNMENTITGLNSSTTSSGGGRGGYSFLNEDRNELTVPPGDASWGPSKREAVGGLGGRPLDYSNGRIFMGGAGGAGEGNDNESGAGGNAGGLVYFKTYGDITGGGNIIANGENGEGSIATSAPFGQVRGKDGAGGGGAGGTVILETATSITFSGQINANGGNGGNQQLVAGAFQSVDQAEGPGGGGSGGYVSISNGSPTVNINGGVNGTTNSPYVSNFPQNGATSGGNGSSVNGSQSNYDITTNGTTICDNTTATLTATVVGSLPLGAVIEWYDAEYGGSQVGIGTSFTTPTLTNTTTYYIKTCPGSFTVPVTVTVNPCATPVPSFESSDSTICINSCIDFTDLSTGNPNSWSWYFFGADTPNSSDQNPTNICYSIAGSFDVALVVNNASGSDSLFIADFITVNGLPTITATPDTSVCDGDTVHLYASGGTNYTWNNGLGNGATQNDIPTTNTTYTVYVTDANGCLDSANVDVTINALPVITTTPDTSVCDGDTVHLYASGGTAYSWNNGLGNGATQNDIPTTNTTYTVYVTDANQCLDSSNVNVTINSLPTVTANASSTTICSGDTVVLSGSGSATGYTWNNGVVDGVSFTPGSTNTYTVVGIDANQCSNSDQVTVTVNSCGAPPVANFSTPDSTICIGECINFTDLSSGAPDTWTWTFIGADSTSSTTQNPSNICFNNIGSFDVELIVSNAFGSDTLLIADFITVNDLPNVVASNDTVVCHGDSATIYASGADSYTWDNGLGNGQSITFFPGNSGIFTVTGTDLNGCSNTDEVIVTVGSCGIAPIASFESSGSLICPGDCIDFSDLSSGNPTNWTWYFPGSSTTSSSVQNPTNICYNTTGDYDVILVASNNFGIDSIYMPNFITVAPLPIINTSPDTSICFGDNVNLSANGGVTYSWDNGLGNGQSQMDAPSANTTYNVTVTDANGCSDIAPVNVTVNTLPTVIANASNLTICNGDMITLSGSGANSYTWDNGVVDGVNFSPTSTAIYTVTGTDVNQCSNTDQITIIVDNCIAPIADFSISDSTICVAECVSFTDLSTENPADWTWYFFGADNTTSTDQNPTNVCYSTPGTYSVALVTSNAFGADSAYYENIITVDSCSTPTITVTVIIPNVFSPNADGHNDLFVVDGTNLLDIEAKIFNRWGEMVYSFDQLEEGWDGRNNTGEEMSDGTYFYLIKLNTLEGEKDYKGTITLIR